MRSRRSVVLEAIARERIPGTHDRQGKPARPKDLTGTMVATSTAEEGAGRDGAVFDSLRDGADAKEPRSAGSKRSDSTWTRARTLPGADRLSAYHAVIVRTDEGTGLPMLAARLRAKRHFGRRVLLALVPEAMADRIEARGDSLGFRPDAARKLRRPRSGGHHPPAAASVSRIPLHPARSGRPPQSRVAP